MKYENLKEFIEIEFLKNMSYEDINKLLNKFNEENKQLEQQIEKMKCCENCEHEEIPDYYNNCEYKKECKNFNKWELED
jgi:HEPN domain-containing protein